MRNFVVDTHTHTTASGHAYSTIIENCTEAGKNGMKMIAMTDHGPEMPGGPHIFHFGNLKVIPSVINGVEVLKGVEANIMDYDGKIDMTESRLKNMDIVLASLHDVCIAPGSIRDNTRALIGAMKNKFVDVIAHSGNPVFPIDIDEVLKAAKEYNVLIEVNNSSLGVSRPGSYENCKRIVTRAVEIGNKLTLGTDSHIAFEVGVFDRAIKLLDEIGVDDSYIINTDENKLKEYLKSKGKLCNRR